MRLISSFMSAFANVLHGILFNHELRKQAEFSAWLNRQAKELDENTYKNLLT